MGFLGDIIFWCHRRIAKQRDFITYERIVSEYIKVMITGELPRSTRDRQRKKAVKKISFRNPPGKKKLPGNPYGWQSSIRPVEKPGAFQIRDTAHAAAILRILPAKHIPQVFLFCTNDPVVDGDDEYSRQDDERVCGV